MTRAGRYAHQQNTKRHAQRSAGVTHQRLAETISTATWLSETMELCRTLAVRYDNSWSVTHFAAHLPSNPWVSSEEAERRLRYLVKLGFLNMSALRDDQGFAGYRFGMVDPNLPR